MTGNFGHPWPCIAFADGGQLRRGPAGEIEPYWQLGMCPTFTSTCHGWSAGPTYALTTMLLGVTPVTPGYADVAVRPALADLRWAEGVVPAGPGLERRLPRILPKFQWRCVCGSQFVRTCWRNTGR